MAAGYRWAWCGAHRLFHRFSLCEKIWNQSYHNCRMLPLIFRQARTESILVESWLVQNACRERLEKHRD
jgi:hypothetical protein